MALFEGKTPAERNKMIAAIVLPLLAFVFVVRMLSGPSGPSAGASPTPTPKRTPGVRAGARQPPPAPGQAAEESAADIVPIDCCPPPFTGAEAGRNIFAFYVKPPPPPGPPAPEVTPATPTPTPPKTLASLAPQSVFAQTGGFTLQISGDKFGPADRVYVDNQELPTQYRSVQQLSATVPASLISNPGSRTIKVQTPDGTLYSNTAVLNVMPPPRPTYTYVGFLKRPRPNASTAVLKDARGELYSVRQGDLVEGRFRVTDISERGVEVTDKDLNIKHTMPFVDARGAAAGVPPGRAPGSIQPPPPDDGDDEP